MPLSGTGMLITLMDVDPDEEVDFNDWYDKEHLAERVGIKGFTEARRYITVDSSPKYLNLYTTLAVDVLSSAAYQKALDNQTLRSQHQIGKFRNFRRAIGQISISRGQGRGGTLFFAAIRPSTQAPGDLRALVEKRLAALIGQSGIISAHLVESDPGLSKALNEDVPPPSASDWYILIDGTDPNVVRQRGDGLVSDRSVIPTGALISHGVYNLLWDLSKAEL